MSINIQLDGKLQKISGQTMTKEKIVEKLGYTPANESTINTTITNLESTVDADIAAVNANLSDLKAALENYIKDHPDIVEDGSGEVVFTDEAGNIIAKLDADGLHTTNIEADSFISGDDNLIINDLDGNKIFQVDKDGVETTKLKLASGDVDDQLATHSAALAAHAGNTVSHVTAKEKETWNNKSDFSGNYSDLVGAPDIVEDESGVVVYVDEPGNIIFKIDSDGAHTTKLELTSGDVDNQFADLRADLAAHTGDAKIHVTTEDKNRWNNKSDFSGDFNDLTNSPFEEDNSGEINYADESGNIIFKIDGNGAHTTELTLTGGKVDERLNQLSADLVAHEAKKDGKDTDLVHITPAERVLWNTKVDAEYVKTEIANLVNSAPDALNTLDELAAALGDDENFATTVTNELAKKVNNDDFAEHEAAFAAHKADATHITANEREAWNNKSEFSGDYADLTNAPDITPEDNEDSLAITDSTGNIVFKAGQLDEDTAGIETVKVIITNDEVSIDVEEELNTKANAADVAADLAKKVDKTTKINGKALSSDITIQPVDVHDKPTGLTAASYTKVTLDEYGHVISGSTPTDITNLGITNVYTKDEVDADIAGHENATNAHTKAQVGLSNVDNTSDADKPVSTATQTALDNLKTELSESITSESDSWTIVDEAGNIVLKAGELDAEKTGLETTTIIANTVEAQTAAIDNIYDKEEVNALVAAKSDANHHHTISAGAEDDDVVILEGTSGTDGVSYKASHVKTNKAGTYTKVTVNDYGHITGGEKPSKVADLGVTDVYTKEEVNAAIAGKTYTIAAGAEDDDVIILEGTPGNNAVSYKATHAKTNKAGTYRSVTVDAYGHVTSGTNPTTIAEYKISDAYTKEEVDAAVAAVTNQNAFSNITVGESTVKADSIEDTLTFVGENIAITPNLLTDTITFSVEDATTGTKGIVQLEDSISSESITTAATPKSVKQAYDLAGTANAAAAAAKVTIVDNLTSTKSTDALSANQGRLLNEAIKSITTDLGNLGGGDMMKATYDKDGDGIVDNAEKLGGNDPDYYASKADLAATEAKIPTVNYPVTGVNGKTGAVTLTAADVNALPASTQIPSIAGLASTEEVNAAVAAVEEKLKGKANSTHAHDNYLDKNTYNTDKATFATKSELAPVSQTATNAANKADSLESRLNGIVASGGEPNTINTIKVNGTALTVDSQKAVDITVPTQTSQLTNNSGFITSIPSEYVTETELANKGYLTAHQDISHLATTNYVDSEILAVDAKIPGVINNLTSTSTTAALSAAQGKALKDAVDAASTLANTANTNASTAAAVAANAQTTATEAKNAVAGIKIPTKVSELTNDSKYLTSIPSEYVTEGELAAALPDIKNDESHNLIIQDNAGNIITAIDATGITTTTVTVDSLIINGEIFSIITDEEIIEMFNEE